MYSCTLLQPFAAKSPLKFSLKHGRFISIKHFNRFSSMGNCTSCSASSSASDNEVLPITKTFQFPSPIASWHGGGGFAKGSIDLGGLEVKQISKFTKVWAVYNGGRDGMGASFFNPSQVPKDYYMLGSYAQPNSKPLFGWVLVASDVRNTGTLAKPVDYQLIWSSDSLNLISSEMNGHGYLWLPIAPEGYAPVGILVTSSAEKPSVDIVRCVRLDFTDKCENDGWIWNSDGEDSNTGLSIFGLRPATRGIEAPGVRVGTFVAAVGLGTVPPIACLKNKDFNIFSAMPDLKQIKSLMQIYSPQVYHHKDEAYFPCSVPWFFNNGALLYEKGNSTPSPIDSNGSNLPQGGTNDGNYWLDLPTDKKERERVKRGDITSTECYLHAKAMLGGTFTDIAIWIFYPFNGPVRAKVRPIKVIPLGKIGEHVGDWEHVTLRISNFTGELWEVYFSEHSTGSWFDSSMLEFEGGANKVVIYAALHSHASYSKPGLVLQGNQKLGIGIRNDTNKGKKIDTGAAYDIVSAEYLGSAIEEPPWLNYFREWGPKIQYKIADEMKHAERSVMIPGMLKTRLQNLVDHLPEELLGEEGPTGPKVKDNWTKDER